MNNTKSFHKDIVQICWPIYLNIISNGPLIFLQIQSLETRVKMYAKISGFVKILDENKHVKILLLIFLFQYMDKTLHT
jgi:hypothetical protein